MGCEITGNWIRDDVDQVVKCPPSADSSAADDGRTWRSSFLRRRRRARGGARGDVRGRGGEDGLLEVLRVEQGAVEVQRLAVEEHGRRSGDLTGLLGVVRHAVDLALLLVAVDALLELRGVEPEVLGPADQVLVREALRTLRRLVLVDLVVV